MDKQQVYSTVQGGVTTETTITKQGEEATGTVQDRETSGTSTLHSRETVGTVEDRETLGTSTLHTEQ